MFKIEIIETSANEIEEIRYDWQYLSGEYEYSTDNETTDNETIDNKTINHKINVTNTDNKSMNLRLQSRSKPKRSKAINEMLNFKSTTQTKKRSKDREKYANFRNGTVNSRLKAKPKFRLKINRFYRNLLMNSTKI